MFRNRQQRLDVIQWLLRLVGGAPDFWGEEGPTPRALQLLSEDASSLPGPERVMLLLAFALWNGDGALSASGLLSLDPEPLAAVGALLQALAGDPEDIDAWIEHLEYVENERFLGESARHALDSLRRE